MVLVLSKVVDLASLHVLCRSEDLNRRSCRNAYTVGASSSTFLLVQSGLTHGPWRLILEVEDFGDLRGRQRNPEDSSSDA